MTGQVCLIFLNKSLHLFNKKNLFILRSTFFSGCITVPIINRISMLLSNNNANYP